MSGAVLGWDVGGANLKTARIEADQRSQPAVRECAFPLWRDPGRLSAMLADAVASLGNASAMAVTMTAELADCFATKRDGVRFVLNAFESAFPGAEIAVYGVDGHFRSVPQAWERPHDVAAANWRASATLVSRTFPDVLFIDTGSTTTDVIPIVDGRVTACGVSDPARLSSGELIYSGALRTPVSAIVQSVPLEGQECRVAAEYFAIAADVYIWLGRIDERDYTCETPDGRGRSRAEAGARIARVICADSETLSPEAMTTIATHVATAQAEQIERGIGQVLSRLGSAAPRVAVLAGTGAFLARGAAQNAGLTCVDLADHMGALASLAAPAVAVAYLLAEQRLIQRGWPTLGRVPTAVAGQ